MAAQASDEQRRAIADELIVNGGSRDELQAAVDAVWERIPSRGSINIVPRRIG